MANENPPNDLRLISQAFEGDQAPGELSVAIVTLVELCQHAMPDPAKVRQALLGAEFEAGPEEMANNMGRMLAIDVKMVTTALRNVRHEIYARDRHGEPVFILLSTADSAEGPFVFCSAIFAGAIEADAVKAAAQVTKRQPLTGAAIRNADGAPVRRVFWDAQGEGGVWGLVVSGAADVESTTTIRAFTAFNKAAPRR